MNIPENLKVGDKFVLNTSRGGIPKGVVVELNSNRSSFTNLKEEDVLIFRLVNYTLEVYVSFNDLEPLVDDINNPYVGMEVLRRNDSDELMYVMCVTGDFIVLSKKKDELLCSYHCTRKTLAKLFTTNPKEKKKTLTKKEIADKFQVGVDELEIVE